MTINSNNFINSLNHRQKPQVILKDVVSIDTLSKIYNLIKMYPDKKVIHFDD